MTVDRLVVLWDNGTDKLSICPVSPEHEYKYIDGIPSVTFGISYENESFKGSDIFTLFDHFYDDTINKLRSLRDTLSGSFRVEDNGCDTDGYLDFNMSRGRLSVKGRLGATFSAHSLSFEFDADQTLTEALLKALSVGVES